MMRLMLGVVALAVVAAAGEANAVVGQNYLTAYDKAKGVRAKAGKYGAQIQLHAKAEAKPATVKTKSGEKVQRKVGFREAVRYCGKTYYVSKTGKNWIAAHEKAGHALVVRAHVAKGKYRVVCGTTPKRVAAKSKAKPRTPKTANTPGAAPGGQPPQEQPPQEQPPQEQPPQGPPAGEN